MSPRPTTEDNTKNGRKDSRRNSSGFVEQRIESLISAPLVAVSKANAMMLTGQVRFLLENCFENKNGCRFPIMIDMVMRTGSLKSGFSSSDNSFIETNELTFQVPLLSLLPLNSLAVERVKVEFGLDITSMRKGHTREEKRIQGKLPGTLDSSTVLQGRISPDNLSCRRQKKRGGTAAHFHIGIEMKAQSLPKGTQTLLDLYARAITPVDSVPVDTGK